MITVMGVDKNKVFILFIIISTTAPTGGLLAGGKVSELIGGYTGPNALLYCLLLSLLASLAAIPIPFLKKTSVIVVLFWLMLFFGAGM